jgi:hypothetical protein
MLYIHIYSGGYLLKQHILLHHKGIRSFCCNKCGKSFGRKTHLQTHARIHAAVKPFGCDLCPRTFATSAELRRHTNQHLGLKPFACDLCDATFVASSDLYGHKRTSHGEAVHQCEHCPKLFKTRGELADHQASVADPGCFILELDQKKFSFRIRIRTFFIPEPGSYIQRGMNNKNYRYLFSCFLWFKSKS